MISKPASFRSLPLLVSPERREMNVFARCENTVLRCICVKDCGLVNFVDANYTLICDTDQFMQYASLKTK